MLEAAFFLPPPLSGSPTLSLSFCPAQAAAVTGDPPLGAHPGTPVCRQEPPPQLPQFVFNLRFIHGAVTRFLLALREAAPCLCCGRGAHPPVASTPRLWSLTSQPAQQPQVKTQPLFTFVGTGGVRDSDLQENT